MINYPLEWGWHTDPETDTPNPPATVPTKPGPSGAFSRSPAEVIYDSPQPGRSSESPEALNEVAWGDRRCSRCSGGGSFGTTGMYKIMGKILCLECAEKEAGVNGAPADEKVETLRPFLLQPLK